MKTHHIHSLCTGALHGAGKHKCPPHWSKDCGIARSCKLFLGTDLERGAPVLEAPVVWPLWNAAENSQRQVCKQSLTLSESTTRDGLCLASRTPPAAFAASVLTLLLPRSILARVPRASC